MMKRFYLSIACIGAVSSLFAGNAGNTNNDEIARGDERGGGGRRDDRNFNHDNFNRNDMHRNDFNRNEGYNRYEHHDINPNAYRYDQNRWNENRGAYSEGIYDGVLLNNSYNPDVEYTQPGSTDNFNQVYQQNDQ